MTLLLSTWLIASIAVGIALGQFLQKCEDNECQQRNAPSPTPAHTAPDAVLEPPPTTMYNIQ